MRKLLLTSLAMVASLAAFMTHPVYADEEPEAPKLTVEELLGDQKESKDSSKEIENGQKPADEKKEEKPAEQPAKAPAQEKADPHLAAAKAAAKEEFKTADEKTLAKIDGAKTLADLSALVDQLRVHELKALIEKINKLDKLTPALCEARDAAEASLGEGADASSEDILTALTQLREAYAAHEEANIEAVPTDELQALVDLAKTEAEKSQALQAAIQQAEAALAEGELTSENVQALTEQLAGALEANADQVKVESKPTEAKPQKDFLDLIDWSAVKNLHKKFQQEEAKEQAAKTVAERREAKLPQTGALTSLTPALLGLSLTAIGAGFALRKDK